MTTAIVGVGNIGSAVARHLVAGGEPVVLTAKDASGPQALAEELGPLARAASVEDAISDADAVLLAVWLDTMRELIPAYASLLTGKVVIDPSNPSASTRRDRLRGPCPTGNPPAR
jgi:8-hydroxy-5-deazaflavin:NADPH oxidoreductase